MTEASAAGRASVAILLVGAALVLVALLALGFWQIERKAWKEDLLAKLDARLAAEPVNLPPPEAWLRLNASEHEFLRVRTTLTFQPMQPVLLYTGASALRTDIKGPGYFIFAPARVGSSGATVVANLGYVPIDRPQTTTPEAVDVVGYLRWPEAGGWFVPERNQNGLIWFVRNHSAMAEAQAWGPVAPFYIDIEATQPPVASPSAGPLRPKLRNEHLGYAITWFGLAGSLLLVLGYLLWTRRAPGGR